MNKPALSIIIPVFGRWELTRACLASLHEHSLEALSAVSGFEVVVADNASTDETPRELPALGAALFGPSFHYLRHGINRNFAGGCNSGAAAAQGELLLFLNNDLLFTPGWLPPLWEGLRQRPDLGAAGPLLLSPNGRVQHLGIAFQAGGVVHLYSQFPESHRVVAQERDSLQALTGAALLTSAALFQACGGFHEGYVNGFEDLELCLRIREQGKKLAVLPQSRIIHLESQTPGRSLHDAGNAELFSRRAAYGYRLDAHRLAALDGWQVSLSPHLDTVLALPTEARQALADLLEQPGPQTLEALRREPLWPEAYAPVCSWLESAGRLEEAMHLAFLRNHFYPGRPALEAWARLATRSGDRSQQTYVGELLKLRLAKEQNPRPLERKANALLAQARENGDSALVILLEDWLARHTNYPAHKNAPQKA